MRLGRPFALLWAGQSLSLIVDQLTRLALPFVAVLVLHATPEQVATFAAAGQLPFLVLALPAGVWVARFGLRRAMLAADVVRGIAILSLPMFPPHWTSRQRKPTRSDTATPTPATTSLVAPNAARSHAPRP